MPKNTFKINIDRQVIKILGAHLYGDTPSVINELIANAHDAYAKNVWITLKTTSPYSITIEDDGIGMTVEEINDYYLNIGYNRREEKSLRSILDKAGGKRADMGQKGIGKLAVFALSKVVNLISVKNGQAVGCKMDFDIITKNNGNPEELDTSKYAIDKNKLSQNQSGTRIELTNVVKDLGKAYRFIAGRIVRSFVMNDAEISIYIRKNDEEYKKIKRSELNFFEEMDAIITIGDFENYSKKVKDNKIEAEYKFISTYNDIAAKQDKNKKEYLDALPMAVKAFDKKKERKKDLQFSFSGWIGTVQNLDSFKKIISKENYVDSDSENEETIVAGDNRITIYSRGKIGEYDILPKIQTQRQNEAYIIGEVFVDDFEHDDFIDMATSNRRGYQEDDERYETLLKNLKILVKKLMHEKEGVNKKRKDDEETAEAKKIEDNFITGQIKSKAVIKKLTEEDRSLLSSDYKQFFRAVSLSQSTKKIFISHNADCKSFGEFLIDVLLEINPALKSVILFTSLPAYGVPHGNDIFDYLKNCFRDDLFVIFLFSKSFYDSNICISEAGAAWATNKNYSNIVLDIRFASISKPINNAQSGAHFKCATPSEKDEFALELQRILQSVDKQYALNYIISAINNVLSRKLVPNLPWYQPKRNFQAIPICAKCKNEMKLKQKGSKLIYECACGNKLDGKIS